MIASIKTDAVPLSITKNLFEPLPLASFKSYALPVVATVFKFLGVTLIAVPYVPPVVGVILISPSLSPEAKA